MRSALFDEQECGQNTKLLLSQKAALEIVRIIEEQDLGDGDKLPNEFELAAMLQVGRGTIREAIKLLVSRNIVEIRRGKGTFVMDQSQNNEDPFEFRLLPDQKKLMADLMDVLLILEPRVAEMAALHASDKDIEALNEAAYVVKQSIFNDEDYLKADSFFHTTLANSSQNTVLAKLIPILIQTDLKTREKALEKLRLETMLDHRAIIEAIAAHDPVLAGQKMREHLQKYKLEPEDLHDSGSGKAEKSS